MALYTTSDYPVAAEIETLHASAMAGPDRATLDAARRVLRERMGAPAVVTASLIAANFSMLDRVANAIVQQHCMAAIERAGSGDRA